MEKKEWYVSCIETMKGTNKRIRATLKNMIYGMKGIEYYGETSEDDAEINRAILKGHADALDLYIEIENTYYAEVIKWLDKPEKCKQDSNIETEDINKLDTERMELFRDITLVSVQLKSISSCTDTSDEAKKRNRDQLKVAIAGLEIYIEKSHQFSVRMIDKVSREIEACRSCKSCDHFPGGESASETTDSNHQ